MKGNKLKWNFEKLVGVIRDVHEKLAAQAGRAINISLTLRNWLIGCYITEYEQRGADRAEYGARLLENHSFHLSKGGMKGVASRSLRQYRQFYLTYPGIWQTPSAKLLKRLVPSSIRQTLPAKLTTTSSQLSPSGIPASDLFQKLSFSHFAELITISDETKRGFYEIECIRGNWAARELKRQIDYSVYD